MVWANEEMAECKFTVDDIDKIISYKTWSDKRR